jgi:hypothetical protein
MIPETRVDLASAHRVPGPQSDLESLSSEESQKLNAEGAKVAEGADTYRGNLCGLRVLSVENSPVLSL